MLFLLLYALWIAFNARVTGEILLLGLPVTGLVWFLSLRMMDRSPREDVRRLRRIPRAVIYLCWLLKEVVVSALRVMKLIWTPGQPTSRVASFEPPLQSRMGRVILADSITLTPGTITAELEEGRFRVHCLEESAAETLGADEMLRRVKGLEGSAE